MTSIPKPFSRPSISLGTPEVPREWRNVPLSSANIDDIVADHGRVVAVTHGEYVVLTFASGRELSSRNTMSVLAFVPKVS